MLQAALIVFTYTVVIGILNGTDVTDFGRKTLLAHVHVGTLGWLTLCVFAASLWLFSKGEAPGRQSMKAARALTAAAVLALPLFAVTFMLTFGIMRPVVGSFALAVIVGFFAWVATRLRHVGDLTTPHWGFLAAMGTSVVGGTIGVLLALRIAEGWRVIPSGGEDAHPGTMVVGFLIPMGLALAEWGLTWPKPERAGRLGFAQMALPFLGGLMLCIGLLLDFTPLVASSTLPEIAGIVIFVKRMWPRLRAVPWLRRSSARLAAFSAGATIFNIGLIQYFIMRYEGDFDRVPDHQLLALDHVMFIGVMTNAILALMLVTTDAADVAWRWAEDAIFWGMDIALIVFVGGLLADADVLKQVSTPVMGAAILLAIATYTYRLQLQAEAAPALAAEGAPGG
ncbi:MAG: hypothetical protein DYG91_11960 [Chloroflexi bacterium CFX7]|nr:MAG: hypothetical protein EDM76_06705 [bacterium]MBE7504621.1 hypothetical protein [Verrucomicrobiales bacterium]MCE7929195.1 hypothetical protein [Chloroflexi bacterium CFX7]RIL01533.1 MAG: hypothetical protein DCC78_10515 [bacterium]